MKTILLSLALALSSFVSYGQEGFLPILGVHPDDTISVEKFTEAKKLFIGSDQVEVASYVVSFMERDSLMEIYIKNDTLGAASIKSIIENAENVEYRNTYVENINIRGPDGIMRRAPTRVLVITYPKKD